ncbi:hypothetical protein WR25_13995 [Diploscapter pachys]|uniref:Uncharacterized protein n=1 Tax=Diploscapter pachys TaxID=2018661 RepID=A0A2A2KVC1_9BILA|nr:hypothetical protein WR25_13995 [Diploscapter pachys]
MSNRSRYDEKKSLIYMDPHKNSENPLYFACKSYQFHMFCKIILIFSAVARAPALHTPVLAPELVPHRVPQVAVRATVPVLRKETQSAVSGSSISSRRSRKSSRGRSRSRSRSSSRSSRAALSPDVYSMKRTPNGSYDVSFPSMPSMSQLRKVSADGSLQGAISADQIRRKYGMQDALDSVPHWSVWRDDPSTDASLSASRRQSLQRRPYERRRSYPNFQTNAPIRAFDPVRRKLTYGSADSSTGERRTQDHVLHFEASINGCPWATDHNITLESYEDGPLDFVPEEVSLDGVVLWKNAEPPTDISHQFN